MKLFVHYFLGSGIYNKVETPKVNQGGGGGVCVCVWGGGTKNSIFPHIKSLK